MNTEALCSSFVGSRVPDYTVYLRTLKQVTLSTEAHYKTGICLGKSRTDSTNDPRNLKGLAGSVAVPKFGFRPVAWLRSLISFST